MKKIKTGKIKRLDKIIESMSSGNIMVDKIRGCK
jgi:hypothetical protein